MRTLFILGGSLLLLPSASFADENAEKPADMQVLYDDAIRLMGSGDYENACPMIERVTAMAPDGLGAKFTLAECYEEQGKLAEAHATFVRVEMAAREKGQSERSTKAAARAEALRPKLVQLSFGGLQSLPTERDVRVEIDGVRIESSQLAEPQYIDGGTHHIVAFNKDLRCGETTLDISAGAVHEIAIEDLVNDSACRQLAAPSTSAESWGSSTSSTVPTWDAEPSPSKPSVKRGFPAWPIAVGGLGLVAVSLGVGFKLDSVAAEKNLVDHCGADLVCPRNTWYMPFDDNARKNRSFGLFVGMTSLGVVALGASTVGLLRWHKAKSNSKGHLIVDPTFSPAHGGVVISGSF